MSKTLIECKDPMLLAGFMYGAEFFTGASVDYDSDHDSDLTWLLIEADDDFDNQTYTLTEGGLEHKECGVEI